ncbi:hypothetical protein ACIQXF_19575 [Lysinibacillus sp. NPDC097231]|uniref:hypothetical protein n=1 Tax=Lysinibacillus sp. NPDC097231 TaxID=3364142 RepID=UPI00380545D4
MRVFSYVIMLLFLLLTPNFLIYHQLPSKLLQIAALTTTLHIIALLIVHVMYPKSRKSISMYQTLFSIVLFTPVVNTIATLLHNTDFVLVNRSFIVIPVGYVILFLTVIFSCHFYKFKDSTK